MIASAQKQVLTDSVNGDWTQNFVVLHNTPEADMMVRSGDIDNLGQGWPTGFDPFSGNNTPVHGFPFTPDSADASGTDRIMVVTSYVGTPPHGSDGYTQLTTRPANLPRPIALHYDLNGLQVTSAALQVFADDFQAPMWGAHYYVSLNGVSASYFADVINSLIETGPIGKMITVTLPQEDLYLIQRDSLSVMIDDTTTGAGDGYAIDFVKLLINTKGFTYTGSVHGIITDYDSGDPVRNAIVSTPASSSVLTDSTGYYKFTGLPAGTTRLSVTKFGYDTTTVFVDLVSSQEIQQNMQIKQIFTADFKSDVTSGHAPLTVHFTDLTSLNPTTWKWHFGDGDSSAVQNPIHTYTAKGLYNVSLTASNSTDTSTEIKTGYIQVINTGIQEQEFVRNLSINPNPANSHTIISYELPEKAMVSAVLYDQYGRPVLTILNENQDAGKHKTALRSENLLSGVYYLEMEINNHKTVCKVVVVN
jgi:hypothetical protein